MADKSESVLIEFAQSHMEKGRPTKAFFCLAMEAIKQLTRIADACAENERHMAEVIDHDKRWLPVYNIKPGAH